MRTRIYLMMILLLLTSCTKTESPTSLPQLPTLEQPLPTPLTTLLPTNTSTPALGQLPTETSTAPTATLAATVEQVPAPEVCTPPANWVIYTVQVNDTLYSLATRTATTVQQVQRANCLDDTLIFAGQRLYLPYTPPPRPTAIIPPSRTPSPVPTVEQPPAPTGTPTLTPPSATATVEQPDATSPTPTSTVEQPDAPGPGDPTLSIEPFSGPVSTTHTVMITGFEPNEIIVIELFFWETDELLLSMTTIVDQDGYGVVWIISQPDYLSGIYLVVAEGDANSRAEGNFVVE
jgi:LysM repeat protein